METVEVQAFNEVVTYLKNTGIIRDLKEIAVVIGYNYNYLSGVNSGSRPFDQKLLDAVNVKFKVNFAIKQDKPSLPDILPNTHGKTIPFYDTEIFGTISPAMSDIVTMKPQTCITIPIFNQGEFALQVTGNSMKGYINHGDWIVVKKITEIRDLIFGEPYLVITRADNLKTVKFIRKGSSEETLTLTPYNTAQFDQQEILKESILEIYKVIGLFRNM